MKLLLLAIFLLAVVICEDDYYKILGVSRSANAQEIKKAFRSLSIKYHPDKNRGDQSAHEMFLKVNKAHEILIDEEKRQIYDVYGEEGLSNQNMMHHGHRQKGPNARVDVHVELEDLYNGAVKEISISKNVVCKKCRGTGGKLGKTKQCHTCGGRGVVMQEVQSGMGFSFRMQNTCPTCSGKGIVFAEKCDVCRGRKVIKEDKTLQVEIEKGMRDGENIVFHGESEQQPDMAPGDLVIHLKQGPHRFFNNRVDNDLHGNFNLNLKEALLGYKRKVVHLDKREITVTSDEPTPPFYVKKIFDEGMPTHRYPSQTGHLFLKFNVRLPEKLSEDEKELVKQLFA